MFWNWKVTTPAMGLASLMALIGWHHHGGADDTSRAIALVRVLDADGNGVLSAAEIDAAPAALRGLDANGDGSVNHAELIGHGTGLHGSHGMHDAAAHDGDGAQTVHGTYTKAQILEAIHFLLQADLDGNGVLDDDEMLHAAYQAAENEDLPGHDQEPEELVRMIKMHDTDGDGAVECSELIEQAHSLMSGEKASHGTGHGHGSDAHGDAAHPSPISVEQIEDHIMSHDDNGDGKLTRQEVPPEGGHLFDDGDANGDGVLDGAEVRAMAEKFFRMHNPGAARKAAKKDQKVY